jgi:hypothetical protein
LALADPPPERHEARASEQLQPCERVVRAGRSVAIARVRAVGCARLSPWPRSRQAAPLVTIPLAAASVSRCLLSGPNRCLCKQFHDDGVAAVPAPGLAPKRDWCADRRASRDYRRRSGLEIGDEQGCRADRAETCVGMAAVLRAVAPMEETASPVKVNGPAPLSESIARDIGVSGPWLRSSGAVAECRGQAALGLVVRRRRRR